MPVFYRYRRRIAALVLAFAGAPAALAGLTSPALAQPAARGAPAAAGDVMGVVLAIEADELLLDLGEKSGAAGGDTVEIWRPVKLKHPVTGKIFTDRFLIGSLSIKQVRPAMSLAQPTGALSREPQVGDVVILPRAAGSSTPVAPAAPNTGTGGSAPPSASAGDAPRPTSQEDREAIAIAVMLDNLRGADPVERIRAYENYVRTQPKGRFARVLYEEAQALRKVYELDRRKQDDVKRGAESPRAERLLRNFEEPSETVSGAPLRLAVELSDTATGAVLHARTKGQPAYTSFPMAPAGGGYFAATLPAQMIVEPEISFFIEATTPAGTAVPVVGQSGSPEVVKVLRPPLPPPRDKLDATVMLLTDFADYNRLRGNDRVWQTEGYFGLRYGDTGVRALRTGFGVYRGVGGTVRDLDELGRSPREVGLTYGYLETEVGVVKAFSVIGRAVVGLDDDGVAGGGQLLIRIGNDLQTNLVIGGELLGTVGARGITQLELNTFPRFPILLRIEVTNQPAGARASRDQVDDPTISQGSGEVGGRGIAQVGMRIVDPLVVSVRGSFQGRTINHAGPGFGAAVSYQW